MWFFNLCFPERKARLLPHFIGEAPGPREDSARGHTARKWESWDWSGLLGSTASVLRQKEFPGEPNGPVALRVLGPGLWPLLRVTRPEVETFSVHLVYLFY